MKSVISHTIALVIPITKRNTDTVGITIHEKKSCARNEKLPYQGCKQWPVNGQCPVKNRFCPVKSLDGRTICVVVYAGKEKMETYKILRKGYK